MPAPIPQKNWIAIAAMGENRAIGINGKIPWHLPEDFRFFKATTLGHVLLMGRKTWDSIGRPLPGRQTLVISRSVATLPGATVFPSIQAVLENFDPQGRTVFVSGGQEIYTQALPHCSQLLATHVRGTFEGDTFFPAFESDFPLAEEIHTNDDFRIVRYQRATAPH